MRNCQVSECARKAEEFCSCQCELSSKSNPHRETQTEIKEKNEIRKLTFNMFLSKD